MARQVSGPVNSLVGAEEAGAEAGAGGERSREMERQSGAAEVGQPSEPLRGDD